MAAEIGRKYILNMSSNWKGMRTLYHGVNRDASDVLCNGVRRKCDVRWPDMYVNSVGGFVCKMSWTKLLGFSLIARSYRRPERVYTFKGPRQNAIQTLAHVRSRHWSPCERDTLKTLLCNINRIEYYIICTEVADTGARARESTPSSYTYIFLYKIRIKAFCVLYPVVRSFFPRHILFIISCFLFSITCYVRAWKARVQFEYFVNSLMVY